MTINHGGYWYDIENDVERVEHDEDDDDEDVDDNDNEDGDDDHDASRKGERGK